MSAICFGNCKKLADSREWTKMLVHFMLHTEYDHWKIAISSWTSYTSVEGDNAVNCTCGHCVCMAWGFNEWEWEIVNTSSENGKNDDNAAPNEDTNSKDVKRGGGGHGCGGRYVPC